MSKGQVIAFETDEVLVQGGCQDAELNLARYGNCTNSPSSMAEKLYRSPIVRARSPVDR